MAHGRGIIMEKYRVLIVDDDSETSVILSNYLAQEYETFVAGNGLDALLRIDQIEPDILIVDVMMPAMSGLEFVRRLRSFPRFERTLVVFLSAKDQDEEIRDGYAMGADVYLTKPFDPETVRILLRNLIEDTGTRHSPKAYDCRELEEFQLSRRSFPQAHKPAAIATGGPAIPRVLIVDDDPVILDLLSAACRPDFEVVTARNGLEALDAAYLFKPDLFVIDWVLPRVSGAQIVRVLQSTLEFKGAPVLIVSAYSKQQTLNYLKEFPISGFFAKPLDPDEITAALREDAARPEFRIHRHRPEVEGAARVFDFAESGAGEADR